MKKRLVSIFLCTVMTACTLVGCTSKSAMENKDSRKEAAKKDGDYSFAFLTNTLNNTFQSSMMRNSKNYARMRDMSIRVLIRIMI